MRGPDVEPRGGRVKILVGTLYTIENEFERCVAAVRRQTHPEVEHFVVRGRGNREAHAELYGTFMARADAFDLFVKVDADMVIGSEQLFANLAERFEKAPEIHHAELPVYDFFTDGPVWGLHAWRSCVRWPERGDGLFLDESPVDPEHHTKDWSDLAPAAAHCPDPAPFQAFHFGLHKGLKLREALALRCRARLAYHWRNIEATFDHFRRRADRRLLLASLGAELALAGAFEPAHVDYTNLEAASVCARWKARGDAERLVEVRRLRRRNRRLLPSAYRLRQLELRCEGLGPALRRALVAQPRAALRRRLLAAGWRR